MFEERFKRVYPNKTWVILVANTWAGVLMWYQCFFISFSFVMSSGTILYFDSTNT